MSRHSSRPRALPEPGSSAGGWNKWFRIFFGCSPWTGRTASGSVTTASHRRARHDWPAGGPVSVIQVPENLNRPWSLERLQLTNDSESLSWFWITEMRNLPVRISPAGRCFKFKFAEGQRAESAACSRMAWIPRRRCSPQEEQRNSSRS